MAEGVPSSREKAQMGERTAATGQVSHAHTHTLGSTGCTETQS